MENFLQKNGDKSTTYSFVPSTAVLAVIMYSGLHKEQTKSTSFFIASFGSVATLTLLDGCHDAMMSCTERACALLLLLLWSCCIYCCSTSKHRQTSTIDTHPAAVQAEAMITLLQQHSYRQTKLKYHWRLVQQYLLLHCLRYYSVPVGKTKNYKLKQGVSTLISALRVQHLVQQLRVVISACTYLLLSALLSVLLQR